MWRNASTSFRPKDVFDTGFGMGEADMAAGLHLFVCLPAPPNHPKGGPIAKEGSNAVKRESKVEVGWQMVQRHGRHKIFNGAGQLSRVH